MSFLEDLFINKNGDAKTWSTPRDIPQLSGLLFLGLRVSAPQLTATYQTNPGRDGEDDLGQAIFGPRTIQCDFYFNGADIYDFELATRDLWSFFFQRNPYYIRSGYNPGIMYWVRPKPYDPSRLSISEMSFTLEFDLIRGFGESLGTTQDPLAYDTEMWQVGEHLPNGQDLAYKFTENNFEVYNASDIVIDPRQHHFLQISLSCIGTPVITNHTTGDVFEMKKALTKADQLLIDGIYPYLNSQHCGRDSNHGIITIAKEWNSFSISGASDIDVSFLFRFLYM